jgi:thiol-disulfide isomerase/thioredoxin
MKRTFAASVFVIMYLLSTGQSQEQFPKIGEKCPEFILKNIKYYHGNKDTVSLGELKGRPIILDFFSAGCTVCFKSFPEVNKLAKSFAGKVEYILVGLDGPYIRESYEKYRRQYKLDLPVVFDSNLCRRFVPSGYPHLMWIDKDGIVRNITSNISLTETNIHKFLNGVKLDEDMSYIGQVMNSAKLNNVQEDDSDVILASSIRKWNITMPQRGSLDIPKIIARRLPVNIVGLPLTWLYKFAYLGAGTWVSTDTTYVGKYFAEPVLEVDDSSMFSYDFSTGRNIYCYKQVIQPNIRTAERIKKVMQDDLENYFGYEAHVENRKMPYLRLIVTNKHKIRIHKDTDSVFINSAFSGLSANGVSPEMIIDQIRHYLSQSLDIVNETHIKENIDIKLDAVMTDLSTIREALRENGFDLINGLKLYKVLVIKSLNQPVTTLP